MKVEILTGYMGLCRHYGWKPSWEGLFAFEQGVRGKYIKNTAQGGNPNAAQKKIH